MVELIAPTRGTYELFQEDANEWLASLPDESVDLMVTDPAYESLEKHRYGAESCRRLRDHNWFDIFPNVRFPEFFAQSYRVMKPKTHVYIMCDHETMFVIKPMGEAAGFHFWKPVIWSKTMGMGYHYRASYEVVLFFEKGKSGRQLNSRGYKDVLEFPSVRRKDSYPTEKPSGLIDVLVSQSSQPGEMVIDPFMGSGVVAESAVFQGRNFMGSDIAERSHQATLQRLSSRLF